MAISVNPEAKKARVVIGSFLMDSFSHEAVGLANP